MNSALSCDRYAFSFSGAPILADISFRLERGGFLSIIGPNGAGKTTLLKSFLRLQAAGRSGGGISVLERPLSSYSQRELARLIAYVPQAGGRIPPFTVLEFLRLSRYPRLSRPGILAAADREAVESALALTGTGGLADRRLDTLSGGERQKAYLAAALAQEADILLLDEPASFLDPKHAAAMAALLRTLNRERRLTLLVVTHDLHHLPDGGEQVLVLRQGKQLYFGPSAALAEEGVLEAAFDHTFTYLRHPRTGRPLILADQS
jgi:iron complex transport system ATP-binding protein